MSVAVAEHLLTADEYFGLPDDGRHKELVRGRVVDEFTLPELLPGFRVPVGRFFE